jgi:transcriptional regulator with XRE-family HTH domain
MSRPTTVRHPLATLRKALVLGRTQLAARLGISRPALEKIERGRNPFDAALCNRAFIVTGVCPGWLARG